MPLADKIIELRKKQGWSQIDLADRLDVSRQSVSKWEMAQAVPELDKIIKMSELFAVTTDYLLKDDIPKPEPAPEPEPDPGPESGPEPEPVPEPAAETPEKPRRKKWPWILAAALLFLLCLYTVLSAAGVLAYLAGPAQSTPAPLEEMVPSTIPAPDSATDLPSGQDVIIGVPTPSPAPATIPLDEVAEEPVEVYESEVDWAAEDAMAAEYAPYGITCDEEHNWYLDGQLIHSFTDVRANNGDFHGTLRISCWDGFLDVRTVRDYDNCDDEGVGELLYLESCDIRQDSAHWTEHHADGHHEEDHHD